MHNDFAKYLQKFYAKYAGKIVRIRTAWEPCAYRSHAVRVRFPYGSCTEQPVSLNVLPQKYKRNGPKV